MEISNFKEALEEMQALSEHRNFTLNALKEYLGLPKNFHPHIHIVYLPKELEVQFKDPSIIPDWIQFSTLVVRGEMLVVKRQTLNLWDIFDGPINFEP